MEDETEIEIVRHAIQRTMELIERQKHHVDNLQGHPEQAHAEDLLGRLQKRLEYHRGRLADLVRR